MAWWGYRLPETEPELRAALQKLGITQQGLVVVTPLISDGKNVLGNTPIFDAVEAQRRLREAQADRRAKLTSWIAVIATVASVLSAVAAWCAVLYQH
jgi:hypothetical protein